MYFFYSTLKIGVEIMTESIDKTYRNGSYIEDPVLTNSTVETGKGGVLRLYKSRTGQAAKDRPRKLWISKTRYYYDKELTLDQLKKVRSFINDMRSYKAAKAAGVKDLVRPQEPRFANVKPRKIDKKSDRKTLDQWDRLANRYESIAANTFNCSGAKVFGEYFLTLTNRDKRIRSKAIADAQYNAFIKRFKRWLSSKRMKNGKPFKYSLLTVKEYGRQGYHYHILLKIMLPISEIRKVSQGTWKHGFVKVEYLKDALKLSKYFFGSKYNRVQLDGDQELAKERITEKQAMIDDFKRLAAAAKAKGKDDLAKSYLASIKDVKDDLKALRRALVKRKDTVIRTSGEIKKTLRVTSQDKFLWQYIRQNAVYMYSELIQVKDVSETGETYILNEIYNDYYKLNREQAAYLYNYIEQLLKQGKAKTK